MTNCISPKNCSKAILAGGEGRRLQSLGRCKPLVKYRDKPLIEHIIDRMVYNSTGRTPLIINTDSPELGDYLQSQKLQTFCLDRAIDIELLGDGQNERYGPLAGIKACMSHRAASLTDKPHGELHDHWLFTSPVDTPLQPRDLLDQLCAIKLESFESTPKIIYARSGDRSHPLHALWSLSLIPALTAYLENGDRRVMGFIRQQAHASVTFDTPELFSNINTPEDTRV